MISEEALEQIAKSKGIDPLTNEIKDNALLFPIEFKTISKDLKMLEKMRKITTVETFNSVLKYIINQQKDLKQPIYVIASYWLSDFNGIERIFTCDGDNDLEEIKQIFKERYAPSGDTFGVTEISYKLIKINLNIVDIEVYL